MTTEDPHNPALGPHTPPADSRFASHRGLVRFAPTASAVQLTPRARPRRRARGRGGESTLCRASCPAPYGFSVLGNSAVLALFAVTEAVLVVDIADAEPFETPGKAAETHPYRRNRLDPEKRD